MSIIVNHRRGTKVEIDSVTPALAELGMETTRKKLRFGDGVQLGGFRLARENWRDTAAFTLVANTNNWAPAAFEELGVLVVTVASAYDLTGLTGGAVGRDIEIRVDPASAAALTIKHQSISSTAANRFNNPTAKDIVLSPGYAIVASYDAVNSRWLTKATQAASIAVIAASVQQDVELQAVLNTIAGRLPRVISRSTLAPPGAPVNNDTYIVPAGATGAWATHTDKLATWSAATAAWVLTTPATDQYVLSLEDQRLLRYSAGWLLPRNNFYLSNELSPSQIAADAVNYNPAGLYLANVVRFSTDQAGRKFTGIAGGDAGQYKVFLNAGTFAAIFSTEDVASTAANRLALGLNVTVRAGESIVLRYDANTSRWAMIGRSMLTFSEFQQEIFLTGLISPAIGADQNNWTPAGLANANTVYMGPTLAVNITGLLASTEGREVTLFNTTAFNVTFKEQSVSSTAANRFAFGGDLILLPNTSCTLRYNGTMSRWILKTAPSTIALAAELAAIKAGSAVGVSDTLANVLTSANANAAGLAIALG